MKPAMKRMSILEACASTTLGCVKKQRRGILSKRGDKKMEIKDEEGED